MRRICLINAVGLTPRLVGEHTPRLRQLAMPHRARPLRGVLPAVTCTAQATMLTGELPCEHGIVGNGWFFRDTSEVRFWQQSRHLVQGETVYDVARRERRDFTCAKLFWWFNQGAAVDWSLTPKPWYGADGSKVFGIHGRPDGFAQETERALGAFPFHTFWGPAAGLACTRWIAEAAARTLREKKPTLTLVYLPHLDYDLQRYGGQGEHAQRRAAELDRAIGTVADAARDVEAEIVVVSEYGLTDVRRPVHLNRLLRVNQLLTVRDGPFGETIDFFESRAFAVADHQIAHVYVRDPADCDRVRQILAAHEGVAQVLDGKGKSLSGLNHPRSGDFVALARPDAWFTYYYWNEDARAPDFARTVDIHRKPGYDPVELFFDPQLAWARGRVLWRLAQKTAGLRTRMDVVPLDAGLVRGSHGRLPDDPQDGPVFLSTLPPPSETPAMVDLKDWLLAKMSV